MFLKEATNIFRTHQKSNNKKRTQESYNFLLKHFEVSFADRQLGSIGPDEIFHFLENLTGGATKSTRRLRYAQLKSFFNFIIDKCDLDIKNPCSAPILSKSFKMPKQMQRNILDKETVDEMIYNTESSRDRLLLELQARCGLRIGEVLSLKASDVSDRKLFIREPKSGKETEVAFMPEPTAKRLQEYIQERNLALEERLFPLCYSTARSFIRELGQKMNILTLPHDLRRHSATYASRNGVPLEIISKVILRHQDLKTTQMYLGKVSDSEAVRWMDILHGK
ncbi:MAG: site-specific integrase [Candidatus Heimdallarchaeota archaeon]|nr:site-specific integrase [Candidatus Heimdallarchaeota archaeon]